MDLQQALVALIVTGCTVYAAWRLMPSALRRPVALVLLRVHWPRRIARPLQRAAYTSGGGCGGCGGCGAASSRRP